MQSQLWAFFQTKTFVFTTASAGRCAVGWADAISKYRSISCIVRRMKKKNLVLLARRYESRGMWNHKWFRHLFSDECRAVRNVNSNSDTCGASALRR